MSLVPLETLAPSEPIAPRAPRAVAPGRLGRFANSPVGLTLAGLLIFAGALALFRWGLEAAHDIYFDETWYVPAARALLKNGEILRPEVEAKRIEGPWGEGLGYYAAGFPQPPVRITAVYYRNDPIILGEPTLRFRDRGAAGGFPRTARRWHLLEQSGLEGVTGVGQVGPFLVVAVKQYYSGQALRIADFAMTGLADRPPRYLVLVDDDIDPTNRAQVEWAITSRVDPSEQVHIERGRWGNAINPAGLTPDRRAIEDYSMGTMIIDACRPFRWRQHWGSMFKESDIDEDLRRQTAEKWEAALGPVISQPKPS